VPATKELATIFNESEDKVVKALQVGKPVKYLDETIAKSDARVSDTLKISDMLVDCNTDVECCVIDKLYLENLLRYLHPKLTGLEYDILISQLSGLSQAQISKKFDVSNMKVSRSVKKITTLVQEYLDLTSP
jgi:RNA polymerase sporulation-specific sigma factor